MSSGFCPYCGAPVYRHRKLTRLMRPGLAFEPGVVIGERIWHVKCVEKEIERRKKHKVEVDHESR